MQTIDQPADQPAIENEKLPAFIYPTADEREADLQQARADWNAARKERERLEAVHESYSVEVPKIEEERVAVLQSNQSLEAQAAALAHLPIKRELLTAKLNESSEALAAAYAVEATTAKQVVGILNERFSPIDERVSNLYASFRALVAIMPIGLVLGTMRNKQAGVGGEPIQYVRSAAEWAAAVEVLAPEVNSQCEGLQAACEDLRERFAKLRCSAEKAIAKLSTGGEK